MDYNNVPSCSINILLPGRLVASPLWPSNPDHTIHATSLSDGCVISTIYLHHQSRADQGLIPGADDNVTVYNQTPLPFTSAPLPYASSSTSPLHLSTSQGTVLPSLPVTSRYHPSTTTHTHELASVVVFSPASLHHEPSPDHRRSPAGPGRDRPGRGQHGVVAASYQ